MARLGNLGKLIAVAGAGVGGYMKGKNESEERDREEEERAYKKELRERDRELYAGLKKASTLDQEQTTAYSDDQAQQLQAAASAVGDDGQSLYQIEHGEGGYSVTPKAGGETGTVAPATQYALGKKSQAMPFTQPEIATERMNAAGAAYQQAGQFDKAYSVAKMAKEQKADGRKEDIEQKMAAYMDQLVTNPDGTKRAVTDNDIAKGYGMMITESAKVGDWESAMSAREKRIAARTSELTANAMERKEQAAAAARDLSAGKLDGVMKLYEHMDDGLDAVDGKFSADGKSIAFTLKNKQTGDLTEQVASVQKLKELIEVFGGDASTVAKIDQKNFDNNLKMAELRVKQQRENTLMKSYAGKGGDTTKQEKWDVEKRSKFVKSVGNMISFTDPNSLGSKPAVSRDGEQLVNSLISQGRDEDYIRTLLYEMRSKHDTPEAFNKNAQEMVMKLSNGAPKPAEQKSGAPTAEPRKEGDKPAKTDTKPAPAPLKAKDVQQSTIKARGEPYWAKDVDGNLIQMQEYIDIGTGEIFKKPAATKLMSIKK